MEVRQLGIMSDPDTNLFYVDVVAVTLEGVINIDWGTVFNITANVVENSKPTILQSTTKSDKIRIIKIEGIKESNDCFIADSIEYIEESN